MFLLHAQFTTLNLLLKDQLENLCSQACLGFAKITLHGSDTASGHTFDFTCFNPRYLPKDRVTTMATSMERHCDSDTETLKAAVCKDNIQNLRKLPPAYLPKDYTTVPHVEFKPGTTTTVFFLTGGTRYRASKQVFDSLTKTQQKKIGTKKPKRGEKSKGSEESETPDQLTLVPLDKVANWIVQLYDFGVLLTFACDDTLNLFS